MVEYRRSPSRNEICLLQGFQGLVNLKGFYWQSGNVVDKFIEKGMIRMSTYLTQFHVGDIVDIKANGAVQKGLVCSRFLLFECDNI